MCRWIVYFSEEPILLADVITRPQHSLVKQIDEHYLPGIELPAPAPANDNGSPNAFTNVDGFGIGWFSEVPSLYRTLSTPEHPVKHPRLLPTAYRCVRPPLHEENLQSMALAVESPVVFGHLRAAFSAVTEPNCHPFKFGPFLFQHNGNIGGFSDILPSLMSIISKPVKDQVKGTTDSEWAAALFFDYLDPTGHWTTGFSMDRLLQALHETISTLINLTERFAGGYYATDASGHRTVARWLSFNVAISDGEQLVALRYAYPPDREAPSLYWSSVAGSSLDRRYERHPDTGGRDVGDRPQRLHCPHVLVASEPMSQEKNDRWHLLKNGEMVVVKKGELVGAWGKREQALARVNHYGGQLHRDWWRPNLHKLVIEDSHVVSAHGRRSSTLVLNRPASPQARYATVSSEHSSLSDEEGSG
ncbi:hypothetical protein JCM5296_006494 [Sporobolomyces johnsonii]